MGVKCVTTFVKINMHARFDLPNRNEKLPAVGGKLNFNFGVWFSRMLK
jgi:hypothetical protein